MSQLYNYLKDYDQMDLLGRGNYGSAYLVQSKTDKQFYVAKKMMLEGLNESEIASAWGQIEILKTFGELKCPFIVQYKECFHFDNMLIIIMEYCEHGDLTTFLKNKKKKDQLLNQKVIVNWFIQMLFGIKVLHSKKVLHRDLKSANIFLTSNKTIKIGDFGISKVLDNTSAKTFVGTPYYLSPEVCENRPYDFKSDLWSLGCILYQMCTLNYPFQASNLLGLAMKILNQQVQPISQEYSKELNEIVMLLLTKNQNHRITIKQLLQKPYIKKQMATFVEDRAKISQMVHIPVRRTQATQQKIQNKNEDTTQAGDTMKTIQSSNEDTMKTINSRFEGTGREDTLNYSNNMTNKEMLRAKKIQESDRKAEQQKQAIRENAAQRQFAKSRKMESLGITNPSLTFTNTQLLMKIQNQNKEKAEMKKTQTKLLQKNQEINLAELNNTLNKLKTVKASEVNFEEVPLPSNMKNKNQADERPLPSTKSYYQVPEDYLNEEQAIEEEINEQLEEYYDEEFEEYEDPPTNKKDTKQIEDVEAFYACFAGLALSPSKKERVQNVYKKEVIYMNNDQEKIQVIHKKTIEEIGQKRFKSFYKAIKEGSFDMKDIKKRYSPAQQKAIQSIEAMVYLEDNVK